MESWWRTTGGKECVDMEINWKNCVGVVRECRRQSISASVICSAVELQLFLPCVNLSENSRERMNSRLAFWAASAHGRVMSSFSSISTPKSFSAGLLSIPSSPSLYRYWDIHPLINFSGWRSFEQKDFYCHDKRYFKESFHLVWFIKQEESEVCFYYNWNLYVYQGIIL